MYLENQLFAYDEIEPYEPPSYNKRSWNPIQISNPNLEVMVFRKKEITVSTKSGKAINTDYIYALSIGKKSNIHILLNIIAIIAN